MDGEDAGRDKKTGKEGSKKASRRQVRGKQGEKWWREVRCR